MKPAISTLGAADTTDSGPAARGGASAAAGDPALAALLRLACRDTVCAFGAVAVVESGTLRLLGGGDTAFAEGQPVCAAALLAGGPLVVPDVRLDPRLAGSALLAMEPPIAFFAATAILVEGRLVGGLCVMDPQPRVLAVGQLEALADLAVLAGAQPAFEAALRTTAGRASSSEELYRSVAAAISDGLYVVGPDCTILATNPAACEILGIEAGRSIGHRLGALGPLGFELLHEDGRVVADVDHPVRRVLQGGASLLERVHGLRRPDGSTRLVQLSVRPLGGRNDASPASCLVVFRDITRQREAEQALRDRQAADLANHAKSEFLSRVSHEMRTPLNAVIGFTQLLRLTPEASAPAQVARYTDHVLRASERLLALINDLLDLQRVDEGRLSLQPGPLAVETAVGATFELLQPLARQHGITLRNDADRTAWVHADAQRLRQVLINIVSNAIKYNRHGGWVRVTTEAGDAGRWLLAVEDSGNGLTQEQLTRLFQPFERLGHETSGIEGSGLGLVIARRLVQEMGGELTLGSAAAAGMLVRIALPRVDAPRDGDVPPAAVAIDRVAGEQPDAPSAADPACPAAQVAAAQNGVGIAAGEEPAAPLRLLYVEDNRINALLFEEALRMRGNVELRVAEDGAEAVALVRDWPPQVLVLDANLPDMSGYQVLARLRELPGMAGVPAFMCSADAMDEDLERATAAGFVGYWTKPIDVARVIGDLDRLATAPA